MHFALPSVPAGPCAEQDISQCYSGEESTDIESEVVDDSDLSSDDTNVVEIDSDPPDLVSSEDEDEMDKVMMCGPCRPGDSLLQHTNCRDANCKDPKTVMLDMTKNEVKSFRVDSMRSGRTRQSAEKRRGRSAARAALPVHEQRKRRRSPGPARYLADKGSAYNLIAKGDLTAKDRKNIKQIMEDITLSLSLITIRRCRRPTLFSSLWSPQP